MLNIFGKRCQRKWGSHQQLIGHNRFGLRSKLAASYRKELCRAICRGILQSVQIDYVANVATPAVFAAGDEEVDDFEEPQQMEDHPMGVSEHPGETEDFWSVEGLLRVHVIPFTPTASMEMPIPFEQLLDGRRTHMVFEDESKQVKDGGWMRNHLDNRWQADQYWTGRTEFRFKGEGPRDLQPLLEESGVGEGEALETPPVRKQKVKNYDKTLKRRRVRTRQLQRRFWTVVEDPVSKDLLQRTLDMMIEQGVGERLRIHVEDELGREWAAHESAHAEVTLILASRTARRMKKPQPHAGPQEVPLRGSYLLLGSG